MFRAANFHIAIHTFIFPIGIFISVNFPSRFFKYLLRLYNFGKSSNSTTSRTAFSRFMVCRNLPKLAMFWAYYTNFLTGFSIVYLTIIILVIMNICTTVYPFLFSYIQFFLNSKLSRLLHFFRIIITLSTSIFCL